MQNQKTAPALSPDGTPIDSPEYINRILAEIRGLIEQCEARLERDRREKEKAAKQKSAA